MTSSDEERWDAKYRAGYGSGPAPADPWIVEQLTKWREHSWTSPSPPRLVDLAGGTGRHALWAAAHGYRATLVDVSSEALQRAHESPGGAQIHRTQWDLCNGPPDATWDVAVIANYLDRPLLRSVNSCLAPGGLLLMVHPTVRNLERNPSPSARFLLEEGELPGLLHGLLVSMHTEVWHAGRHLARVAARRASGRG